MVQPPTTAPSDPVPTPGLDGRTMLDPAAVTRLRQQRRADAPQPWLHGEIARRMADRLSLVRQAPTEVLDWWPERAEGTDALVAACPQARRWQVEAGDPNASIRPAPTPDKAWWRQLLDKVASSDTPAAPPVDLLWANMMLHWADPLPALLAQWHRAIRVDGYLMFSSFGPDTLRELRPIYRAAGWGEPASPCIDMHDLGDELVRAGFADPVMDMETLKLSWAGAPALLAELRSLGRNTHPQRHAGLRTPRWNQRLQETLAEQLAGPDGRLTLTFEIVYGHAFRAVTRAKVSAQTSITLDAMREMTRRRNPPEGA
ncbi:biotin synthase [Sphaerotilus mobilis]|nr:biotin synthase [Sphaerotilus mobilis]